MTPYDFLTAFITNFMKQCVEDSKRKPSLTLAYYYTSMVTQINALHDQGVLPPEYTSLTAASDIPNIFTINSWPEMDAAVNRAVDALNWDVWPVVSTYVP